LLPGTTKKDEYVVVSAHYDHIGIGRPIDGDAIHNGADDDASGTTAVLLLAGAMQRQPPPVRSVLFVCFAGEEKGLKGSAAFCDRPPVPLERIVANLNIEMIGRPEPGNEGKAWITGAEYSDFAKIVEAPLQRAGVLLVDFRMATQLFAQSDNWSFVQKGIVAHSLSAGSLHADYHRPSDEVAKLDLPHMTRIIGALLPAVRELADRDAVPRWNEKGRKFGERGRR
jgi:Zn-dependent M28 family amino/carboxypeptidase